MKVKITESQCQLKLAVTGHKGHRCTHQQGLKAGRQKQAASPSVLQSGSTGRHCPLWRASSPLGHYPGNCLHRPAQRHVSQLIQTVKMVTTTASKVKHQSPVTPSTFPASLFSILESLFLLFPNLFSLRDFEVLQHPHLEDGHSVHMISSHTWMLASCFFFHFLTKFSKFGTVILESTQMPHQLISHMCVK